MLRIFTTDAYTRGCARGATGGGEVEQGVCGWFNRVTHPPDGWKLPKIQKHRHRRGRQQGLSKRWARHKTEKEREGREGWHEGRDSKKYTESLGSAVPSGCVSIFITLSAWYAHKFKAVHIVYLNAAAAPSPQKTRKPPRKSLATTSACPCGTLHPVFVVVPLRGIPCQCEPRLKWAHIQMVNLCSPCEAQIAAHVTHAKRV